MFNIGQKRPNLSTLGIMKMRLLLLLCCWSFTSISQPVIVSTDKGRIEGSTQDQINIFKGIPFAAPPTGDLRWKAPQPVQAWQGVKKCVQFSASPAQASPMPFMYWSEEFLIPKEPISEDCLYLNVWTPSVKPSAELPVLVYIYGGGFRSGGTACPIYDGAAMAKKGILFVSINYRVGLFGFMAHPELSAEAAYHHSGNYGILDMIAGLQWVQKNIAAFGGDPSKVTIAGQSAGSFAVSILCASPLAKGLFRGAIAESGASVLPGPIRPQITAAEAEQTGVELAKALGCKNLAELRAKPTEEIINAKGGLNAPYVDGYVLPASLTEIYTSGRENKVALMMGWNADDKIMGTPAPAADYIQSLQKRFGDRSKELLAWYPATDDATAAVSQGNMNRDESFGVQMFAWAALQEKARHPVYMYRFNRALPAATSATAFGAFHSGEIVYAYDNLATLHRPWEKADQDLATTMSAYWSNFTKTGNPNGKGLPNWPVYHSGTENLQLLDAAVSTTLLPEKKALQWWVNYYNSPKAH
jgi:para-nitrobenzyl esterase